MWMVALTNLNLPPEAWKSARLLRAVPDCRLVLMLSYHMLSPALSVEEPGLMTYLQAPRDAGPSVGQVTTGLQNWKSAGRRLLRLVVDSYGYPSINLHKIPANPSVPAQVEYHANDESQYI